MKLKTTYPVIPGDTLMELLEYHNMTQAQLARIMGRPLKLINEIRMGKAAITPQTALQLEKVFNKDALFWLNLQTQFDLAIARSKLPENQPLTKED